LRIYKHTAGYFENTASNTNAIQSIAFIGTIAVFLILLVHIAGRRWEKEGRLTYG
jgi:hypothetical protein